MTEKLTDTLNSLKADLATALEKWNLYISSLEPKRSRFPDETIDAGEADDKAPIATAITTIDSGRAWLHARIGKLSRRDYTIPSRYALPSTAELIRRHLPTKLIGAEAANHYLSRALKKVEDLFLKIHTFACAAEAHFLNRLECLQSAADAIIGLMSSTTPWIAFNVVRATTAARQAGEENEMMRQKYEQIMQENENRERLCHYGRMAYVIESCALELVARASCCRIRAGSQELITEYYDWVDGELELMVFWRQFQRKLSKVQDDMEEFEKVQGRNRLITEFFA